MNTVPWVAPSTLAAAKPCASPVLAASAVAAPSSRLVDAAVAAPSSGVGTLVSARSNWSADAAVAAPSSRLAGAAVPEPCGRLAGPAVAGAADGTSGGALHEAGVGPAEPGQAPGPRGGAWRLVLRELGDLVLKVAAVAGAVFLIFTFVFGLERVGDPGMAPAVQGGDLVAFYRIGADYKAGDVVVVDKVGVGRQVRRVAAVAGDQIDVTDQGLTVNGNLLDLGDAAGAAPPPVDPSIFPLTLGQGEVFVLGDALGASLDSRSYGAVSSEDVAGEVVVLIRRRGF